VKTQKRKNIVTLSLWPTSNLHTLSCTRRDRTHGQRCQMLDRKYGKCLSNLWHIFGKKIMKMAKFMSILVFHYKMTTFWRYWYHSFCNSYFFHTFEYFKAWQLRKSMFYGNQYACSVGEIYPLFNSDQWFSKWTESPTAQVIVIFLAQSNCDVIDKYEGVIVIELTSCNWSNSVVGRLNMLRNAQAVRCTKFATHQVSLESMALLFSIYRLSATLL